MKRKRWKGFVLLLIAVLLVWLAWRMPGFDAIPAVGQTKVAAGAVPITYHQLIPLAKTRGTVVLLASLGRPASDFNALVTTLAANGWRTLTVESRGVGSWRGGGFFGPANLSGFAADVIRVLDDAHEAAPVVVLGHAFGNRVARMVAERHPTRIAAVVLLAAGDQPQLPPHIERLLKLSTLSPLPFALRKAAVSRCFFAPGTAVSADWQRGWSAWAALAQSRAVRATPANQFHNSGNAPVLVVQPANDLVAPPKKTGLALVNDLGARGTLVIIPNAGHALLPEQPKAVAEAVLNFLNGLK